MRKWEILALGLLIVAAAYEKRENIGFYFFMAALLIYLVLWFINNLTTRGRGYNR